VANNTDAGSSAGVSVENPPLIGREMSPMRPVYILELWLDSGLYMFATRDVNTQKGKP
jgi:hypothetical protein